MSESPKIIYLIRHQHKDLTSPVGNLSVVGFKEAKQLVKVFTEILPCKYELPIPTNIYSQYPNDILSPPNPDSVNRVYQTVTPLASSLKLKIKTKFDWTKFEFTDMVNRVKADNIRAHAKQEEFVPLIAWQHDSLPDIAELFGFEFLKSWGLYPLLPLPATETECDYSQLWVLINKCEDSHKIFKNYQMLFPDIGTKKKKQEPKVVKYQKFKSIDNYEIIN